MTIKFETLSADELRNLIEDMWSDATVLKSQFYFLMQNLENALDPERGRRDGDIVKLLFWDEDLEAMGWLTGCAWSSARKLENGFKELFAEVES